MRDGAHRVIVAEPDEVAPGARGIAIPVGLARARGERRWTVIVKATFELPVGVNGAVRLASEQEPLRLDAPCAAADAVTGELDYASDFDRPQSRTDVLVIGHARGDEASSRLPVRVAVAGVERSVIAVAAAPALRIPLRAAHLRDASGERATEPLGPRRSRRVAPSSQRIAALPSDAAITLSGLSSIPAPRRITLPGLAPRVTIEALDGGVRAVEMACDRLWIDADREIVIMLWRGSLAMDPGRAMSTSRVAVSLEREGGERDRKAIRRGIVRGPFAFAIEEDDLRTAPADPDRLALARQELWAELWTEGETDPTRPLDEYARISAILAEGRGDRAEVLAEQGFDEERWSIEEQGWLMKMARDASDADGALAIAYGARFVAEQDRLARPEETEIGLDDYVAIRDAVEQADDPQAALRAWALTLPMWMRLQRRVTREGLADRARAAETRAKLAAARGARGERA